MNKFQIPSTKFQTNPKSQAPNSKQIPNFKTQIPNCFKFVFLDFVFVWCLVLGAWNFT
jgi:hypothetical protein